MLIPFCYLKTFLPPPPQIMFFFPPTAASHVAVGLKIHHFAYGSLMFLDLYRLTFTHTYFDLNVAKSTQLRHFPALMWL